jgi:effector-binding domain-containing protein
VEVAVPVEAASVERTGDIPIRELDEVRKMATAVHHGSPYSVMEAYQALGMWIQKQGYTIIGPCRKVCLQWSGDLNDYFTEIQFPVDIQAE